MTAPEPVVLGDSWTTHLLPARLVAAGDVIADLRGLLWMVTHAAWLGVETAPVALDIARGEKRHTTELDPEKPVRVLLDPLDRRALNLFERELGAETVDREVA